MAQTTEPRFEDVITDMRRSLKVFWDDSGECGMVFFMAEAPDEDTDTRQYRGLDKYAPDLTPGSRQADSELAQKFHPHLVRFFQEATLEPGDHEIPLIHLRDPQIGGLYYSLRSMNFVQIPLADKMRFTVTQDHLKLLKHLRFVDLGGTLGSHYKRPYGDMSYHALDMAGILGEPDPNGADGYFSKDRGDRYQRLHEEMFLVVLAFWSHAKL